MFGSTEGHLEVAQYQAEFLLGLLGREMETRVGFHLALRGNFVATELLDFLVKRERETLGISIPQH